MKKYTKADRHCNIIKGYAPESSEYAGDYNWVEGENPYALGTGVLTEDYDYAPDGTLFDPIEGLRIYSYTYDEMWEMEVGEEVWEP